jgi:hypothetical protein
MPEASTHSQPDGQVDALTAELLVVAGAQPHRPPGRPLGLTAALAELRAELIGSVTRPAGEFQLRAILLAEQRIQRILVLARQPALRAEVDLLHVLAPVQVPEVQPPAVLAAQCPRCHYMSIGQAAPRR